jgi:hypothetical protein
MNEEEINQKIHKKINQIRDVLDKEDLDICLCSLAGILALVISSISKNEADILEHMKLFGIHTKKLALELLEKLNDEKHEL